MQGDDITLKIKRVRVELDPSIEVFHVEMKNAKNTWSHSAGSVADLRIFLEGVRAGVGLSGGYLSVPEIPANAEVRFTLDRGQLLEA